MVEFKRAKPLPMPDDWEEVGRPLGEARRAFFGSAEHMRHMNREISLQIPKDEREEGFWIGRGVNPIPTRQECYAIFETIIADEVWSRWFFDPDIHVITPHGHEVAPDKEAKESSYHYLARRTAFIDCWIERHTSYSRFCVNMIFSFLYTYTFTSVVGFLSKTMTVEQCYAEIDEEYDYAESKFLERLKEVEGL